MSKRTGNFTLPGESGYEALTLEMAKKWGADVIRDSDGTELSKEITDAGYGIYSTVCVIRDHNEWAQKNRDKLQQTFLVTQPKVAVTSELTFILLEDFFDEQFQVNDSEEAQKYWEVYDRTSNECVSDKLWIYDSERGVLTVKGVKQWHKYTVSFLAYRIWEEISMYNHTTNHWDKEHLMQIDPRYPETQKYLLNWMKEWCETHPATTVVRFTSLFYNFVWIWGSNAKNRNLFTDWGSYDFTVSPLALKEFEKTYGYSMTAENFVNKGQYHVTHMPCDSSKKDWMEFIHDFVVSFGKKLVEVVHTYGKKAYVFYDDSWVGLEPYGERFHELGFDGLIKCVFSGYETRLCAGVNIGIHELRLHPYLFPVGLGGAPTFMEGGNPTLDAKQYWNSVRRALLREPVERIGLGGYLHLIKEFPDFQDYIEEVSDEFRFICDLHRKGKPYTLKPKVGILHTWGKLRPWTLSGHFHETYMHDLIHINESLAGLPLDVRFISFEDIKTEALEKLDVVINAGYSGSAWSGGDEWKKEEIIERLTKWVYDGGCFIGVNEPSACEGYDTFFRMAHVLGVDEDRGTKVCHGRWEYEISSDVGLVPQNVTICALKGCYLTDGKANVFLEKDGVPVVTVNSFGAGSGIYLSSYEFAPENTRMLQNLILYGCKESVQQNYVTDNINTECAYFPEMKCMVVINNNNREEICSVETEEKTYLFRLKPYEMQVKKLQK